MVFGFVKLLVHEFSFSALSHSLSNREICRQSATHGRRGPCEATRQMGAADALLSELGVTAVGERDVAVGVLRDAALASVAREASARKAPAAPNDGQDDGDASAARGAVTSRGGQGGGGGAVIALHNPVVSTPATRKLWRLQEETDTVATELATVRDALEDVKQKQRDGTAARDAALVVAVGERRVAGLVEKGDDLRNSVHDQTAVVKAEQQDAKRKHTGSTTTAGAGTSSGTSGRKKTQATLAEDDDLDALLDSISRDDQEQRDRRSDDSRRGTVVPGTSISGRNAEAGETERERLIRTGVLTPFASLTGFERRVAVVSSDAATEHAVAATNAWRAGRSRAVLLEGDAVPKQHPAAQPFARQGGSRAADVANGARMAERRKEWRGKLAENKASAENENDNGGRLRPKKRRRRRQHDAAYSSDEEVSDDEVDADADAEEEPVVAPAPARNTKGKAQKRVATSPTSSRGPGGFVIPKREPHSSGATVTAGGHGGSTRVASGVTSSANPALSTTHSRWSCPACTFANEAAAATCELCDAPRIGNGNAQTEKDDDDVEFIGEVVAAPTRSQGEAGGTAGITPRGKPGSKPTRKDSRPAPLYPAYAPPPPRCAAVAAGCAADRAARDEAEDLSESGSEYDGNDDEDEDEDEDDEEEEEEVVKPVVAVPRRARTATGGRGGSAGGSARPDAAAAAARPRSRQPGASPGVSLPEEEIVFDGGLRLSCDTYDKLLEHQKTSLKWLWELHCQRAGGIVGDEMGLGKTVQVSAFLNALHRSGLYKPSLVVCPATMLRQWRRELRIWAPSLKPTILHESAVSATALALAKGDKKLARRVLLRECVADGNGVLLTTYDTMRVMRDTLLPIKWGYAVLDEGHKIRNPDADVTICAKQLQTVHRVIMTGAPIQNRLAELWSLFDFCFPGKLGTLPVFQAEFAVPIQVGGYSNASNQQAAIAFRCATTLKDLISPFLLRRMKCDVNISLPKKTEQVLFCPMTTCQQSAYRAFVNSRDVEEILDGKREALSGIDVLRKIVNHPDLLERATKAAHAEYGAPERSGKQMVTMKVLQLWRQQKHRVLLFSQTQQMLDILEAMCATEGYNYRRMDGQTPVSQRMRLIDEFNTDDRVFVFLLTTKVGGLGVNLTGADRVLLFDPDWNPSTDAQARERAWRIGQTKEVTVYRLITAGTIEEKVYHRQIYKEFLTTKVLRDPRQRRFFKSKDLADLFSWEEDTYRNGNAVAGGGIETVELFAEVEGELTAADFAGNENGNGSAKEDGEVDEEDGDDDDYGGDKVDDAWDPNAEGKERKRKRKPANGFRVATVPHSAGTDHTQTPGDGDAAIMRTLFGGGGDGMIRGAMNHDAIMSASGSRDGGLVGGAAAAEADRVARRAHQAVAQSGRARLASNVAVPTWTGRSGAAGAPAGVMARQGGGSGGSGRSQGGGGGRFGGRARHAAPRADEVPVFFFSGTYFPFPHSASLIAHTRTRRDVFPLTVCPYIAIHKTDISFFTSSRRRGHGFVLRARRGGLAELAAAHSRERRGFCFCFCGRYCVCGRYCGCYWSPGEP